MSRFDNDLIGVYPATDAFDMEEAFVEGTPPPYPCLEPTPSRAAFEAMSRKDTPMCTGVLDYFPDALKEIARVSKIGNDQHNPGQPLHWAREKSTDHADCIVRHLTDRGKFDNDGRRHSGKMAWRALALLQTEIEQERS